MSPANRALTVAAIGWLLTSLAFVPAAAQGPTVVEQPGPLRLAAPVEPVKSGTAVYLVQLREPGAASYKGDRLGLAATKPAPGRRFNARSGDVERYVGYVESAHDRLLAEIGAPDAKLYSYRYALNGFAARLSPAQAARLAQNAAVERVWRDEAQHVRTNNSATFLGLHQTNGGLRADLGLRGEGVVIGIIDSGIAPEHPALRDYEERIPRACNSQWARSSWLGRWLCHSARRNPPRVQVYGTPERFNGVCQEGERFSSADCNNKLVGARYYADGFLFTNQLDPNEFLSPRDADGHGTHTSTIAAGNEVTATLFGASVGQVAGIAPRAQLAVYKACWLVPGSTRATCAMSDLTRAIDDAVADGVDIINYSVGSMMADLTRPDDLSLLNALDAGVLSVVAAGNDGPELATIGSPSSAPWVLTVAASTQSGPRFEEALEILRPASLAGSMAMREASFTPQLRNLPGVEAGLVLADDGRQMLASGAPGSRHDACEPLINAPLLAGRIALVERGGCEFQEKLARVQEAGAVAAVVYNNVGAPITMNGDAGSVQIPAVMIGTDDGQRLVERLMAGTDVGVRLAKGIFVEHEDTGNRLGAFSSRGPSLGDSDFVKPDLTAPGVNILAGHTPDVANGLKGESFQYMSGTSMAAPEVAGIAALLKEAHPDWTPAMLKSALMTTATQSVVRDNGSPAHPFDRGSGHIDANRAVDPGLVYDSSFADHAGFLCGLEPRPFPASDCRALVGDNFAPEARQLNLPSVGVTELVTDDTITRRVTNVGPTSTYTASVEAPAGIDVFVDPPSLSLATGQTGEFNLTFLPHGAPFNLWSFGKLTWNDGERSVASPLALRPVPLRAPEEVYFSGAEGVSALPVAFGYTGAYAAGVHGLQAALVLEGFVDEDTSREFSFRFGDGVSAHFIDIPPDQLYARFVLLDELTDGEDDLDLYLFRCMGGGCRQVAESGNFNSDEQIDLLTPDPGLYVALVHGFETDARTGPGAHYALLAWSLGFDDDAGNLVAGAPASVSNGDRLLIELSWSALEPGARHLGAISHSTPDGIHSLTLVNVD